jgi:hypothetical protein
MPVLLIQVAFTLCGMPAEVGRIWHVADMWKVAPAASSSGARTATHESSCELFTSKELMSFHHLHAVALRA